MSQRLIGIILVIMSASAFGTTGVFTKGVEADAGSVLFWRCLSGAIFALVYLALRKQVRQEFAKWSFASFQATLCLSVGTILLMNAYKLTSVANVGVIWASAPFFAAILSWMLLKERPSRLVSLCSLAAFLGAFLAIGQSGFSGHSLGDLFVVVMNICMAFLMIIYRRHPDLSATLPAIISSLLVPLAVIGWTEPLDNSPKEVMILIASGFVYVFSMVTMLEGAKRLSPVEVTLLGSIEVPLSILLAYLIIAEDVSFTTIIGASIVMIAVIVASKPS